MWFVVRDVSLYVYSSDIWSFVIVYSIYVIFNWWSYPLSDFFDEDLWLKLVYGIASNVG